jgi:molybdopterin-guanine dinucleotide biosynthesis protein
LISLPNFLVIGSYSRNAGKTSFTKKIINQMNGHVIALKVTVIKKGELVCPRGGTGCGICHTLEGEFDLSEELDPVKGKDTSQLLAAGAAKVYWLRVKEDSVNRGMKAFLKLINSSDPVICESNSIMKSIKPSLFFLLQSETSIEKKQSARFVEKQADLIVKTTETNQDFDFSRLSFEDSHWSLKF